MLTVNQLAKTAGISVRTLHYYDEIGLLKPSLTGDNGYRYYNEEELLKLQQILFFRELEFPLAEIIAILKTPDFDPVTVLEDQKRLLAMKKERLEKLINTINTTVRKRKGGENMANNDLFGSFTDKQAEQYREEARQRWGNTAAYKQSAARTRNWTKADYLKIEEEGKKLTAEIAGMINLGPENPEVQVLIGKHHRFIEKFYDLSAEMYRNLGKMYVEDERFTKYYEKFHPGMAGFMSRAIAGYCDKHPDLTKQAGRDNI